MNIRLRWSLLLGCAALTLVCGQGSTALLVHAFEGPYPASRGGETIARPDVAPARAGRADTPGTPGPGKVRHAQHNRRTGGGGAETLVASGN